MLHSQNNCIMKIRKIVIFCLIGIMVQIGCQSDHLKVPISNIDLSLSIQRFEQDLFNQKLEIKLENINALEEKYGQFLSLFSYVVNIGQPGDSAFPDLLKSFVTDRLNNEVFLTTQETFPDLSKLEKELNNAFKHYLYYYPNRQVPGIYTFISGFNSSIIIDNNILAIGLDRYLGADCKYYPQLGIPKYLCKNMTEDKIPYDCMYAWASTEFAFNNKGNNDLADNVLNNLIYEGKLSYFVKAMMPDADEAMIFGFTNQQMEWCKQNESDMWTHLVENKLLYSTDRFTIKKLIGDAPFTSYFPRESPGKAAVWLGYQIIKQYIDKELNVSLPELMENSDYQEILRLSKYDPR